MYQLDSLLAETMKVIEKSKDLVNIFGVFFFTGVGLATPSALPSKCRQFYED